MLQNHSVPFNPLLYHVHSVIFSCFDLFPCFKFESINHQCNLRQGFYSGRTSRDEVLTRKVYAG